MPCDSYIPKNMTPIQRKTQIEQAIEKLNKAIAAGQVSITVDRNTGAVGFKGDWQREGITDACAYRKLSLKGGFEFKKALMKAEAAAGRKVNEKAVAAGVHTHDGGKTWHPGHK